MFNKEKVKLGIAPIGWCNDDMPELGSENTFRQIVSEMALAGFTGCEIGNKYPSDAAELKWELDLRGMRIASRWFSSFLVEKPYEEVEAEFIKELDFLAAVGANRINVSEQSGSIQGKTDVPVLVGDHKPVMNDEQWDRFCDGLNRLVLSYLPEYDAFANFDKSVVYKFMRGAGTITENGIPNLENDKNEIATYKRSYVIPLLIVALVLLIADIALRKLKITKKRKNGANQ